MIGSSRMPLKQSFKADLQHLSLGHRGHRSFSAVAHAAPRAEPLPGERKALEPSQRVPVQLSSDQLQRNADLAAKLKGKLILAPLTRGGHLPFRRLCADFGAEATMSEMVFARQLIRGNPVDRNRMKRAANEALYGFQIATNAIEEGIRASEMAAEAGADWLDLNCGCPIHEATKRGMGAVLLRKPAKLARLVAGIAERSALPLTVKIRTGAKGVTETNTDEIVGVLQDTGAAAITIHGRTMEQRYKRPANWELISEAASNCSIPIIGNGDALTHYEVSHRMQTSGCLTVMAGRGALIKPWIFQEVKEGKELTPSAKDRVEIYRRLVAYMKEHFGDDARGRQKAWSFLPWHFDFFHRYRPLPEEVYGEASREAPLLGRRKDLAAEELGETVESLDLLERLLRCESTLAHEEMASLLWDSSSDKEAIQSLESAADSKILEWEEDARSGNRDGVQIAQG